MIIDIHSHHSAPYAEGIVNCSPASLPDPGAYPGQLYSVGIHPWDIKGMGITPAEKSALAEACSREDVVAIGECGIDQVHGKEHGNAAPLFSQLLTLKAQVELSEKWHKPLILHCVRAWDIIIGIRKDMGASQPWVIHGFRGKPAVLEMLQRAGIYVSYGEMFNAESVELTALDAILAETDDSSKSINEIIETLSALRPEITPELIATNVARVFSL